jgi:hypothetical protein
MMRLAKVAIVCPGSLASKGPADFGLRSIEIVTRGGGRGVLELRARLRSGYAGHEGRSRLKHSSDTLNAEETPF